MREFFVEKLRNRRRKKLYSKQIIQKKKKFLSSRVNQVLFYVKLKGRRAMNSFRSTTFHVLTSRNENEITPSPNLNLDSERKLQVLPVFKFLDRKSIEND